MTRTLFLLLCLPACALAQAVESDAMGIDAATQPGKVAASESNIDKAKMVRNVASTQPQKAAALTKSDSNADKTKMVRNVAPSKASNSALSTNIPGQMARKRSPQKVLEVKSDGTAVPSAQQVSAEAEAANMADLEVAKLQKENAALESRLHKAEADAEVAKLLAENKELKGRIAALEAQTPLKKQPGKKAARRKSKSAKGPVAESLLQDGKTYYYYEEDDDDYGYDYGGDDDDIVEVHHVHDTRRRRTERIAKRPLCSLVPHTGSCPDDHPNDAACVYRPHPKGNVSDEKDLMCLTPAQAANQTGHTGGCPPSNKTVRWRRCFLRTVEGGTPPCDFYGHLGGCEHSWPVEKACVLSVKHDDPNKQHLTCLAHDEDPCPHGLTRCTLKRSAEHAFGGATSYSAALAPLLLVLSQAAL